MDPYTYKLGEADLEFAIRIQMRCRYGYDDQEEDFDDLDEYENLSDDVENPIHLVKPVMLKESAIQNIKNAARAESEEGLHQALEDFFTFRLFQMLGVKTLPPTIRNGQPDPEDFTDPQFVRVVHLKEM